ncbi:MAG: CHASE2 domain-containing protein [Leptolyngbya sp. SIO1D8]|nr:CHASE2 domain-containing protein [Leptolyngbya sp. SIO1D8]
MTKQVWLELDGDLTQSGFRVTLEIRNQISAYALILKGHLPAAMELATQLQNHWHDKHRALGAPYRIKTKRIIHKGTFNRRLEEYKVSAHQVQQAFNQWLKSDSFRPLYDRLQQELHPQEEIHFLIRSEDALVKKLPWPAWELFDYYPKAESALSPLEFEPGNSSPKVATEQVRLLVILGHSEGINVTKDVEVIQQLPYVKPTFLIEPKRTEISEALWSQPWDIIFFAGHSATENEQGVIYINPRESIAIDDLWLSLRQAVNQGLQLAIFNSCDGLGLAQRLNDLNIPQMIVMRELVPDRVAQQFLKYFLVSFSSGQSLYQAMRLAREQLDEMEEQFPCAGWLPVLCQNPAVMPPRWRDLYRLTEELDAVPTISPPVPSPPSRSRRQVWQRLIATSLVVAFSVMGIRWLGFLEMPELLAFDQLMRSRPTDSLAAEILLVEATPEDTKVYNYPLEDGTLATLLKLLQAANPIAIGLAMHRAIPRGEGREQLLEEFTRNSNLVTLCSANPETDHLHGAPEELSQSQDQSDQYQGQVGFGDLYRDNETFPWTLRRQVLSYQLTDTTQNSLCVSPYSFSLRLAAKWMAQQGTVITTTDNQEWQFGDIVLRRLPHRYGAYQSLDGVSNQLLLNYRNMSQPAQQVTITEVLEGQVQPALIRNRIVIIGTNNSYVDSFINTPHGAMPTVRIQAHMVSHLIDIARGTRSQIWAMPQWGDALLVW